jgi:pyroglutamyl-peptidase
MADASAPVLLSGFGPFHGVSENPSGLIARALAAEPWVHSVVLPVSFRGAPPAFDAALAALAPVLPLALVGLGVHPDPGFRLERRACHPLRSTRPDVEGICAAELAIGGSGERCTDLDLDALAGALRRAGARVRISSDAGGYVCERLYLHALETGERLGVPGVFLHVPPLAEEPLEAQVEVVRALLSAIRSRAACSVAGARGVER